MLCLSRPLSWLLQTQRLVQEPNSWTYNFVGVSGHNLKSSWTWGFCMDFDRIHMFLGLRDTDLDLDPDLQERIVRKTLIPTVLWLLYDFLSLKNDVNVPSKSNKSWRSHWRKKQDPDPDLDPYPNPDPLVRGKDPRIWICIWIHSKISWICNTVLNQMEGGFLTGFPPFSFTVYTVHKAVSETTNR